MQGHSVIINYIIQMLLLVPTAAFALLPVRASLRVPLRRMLTVTGLSLAILIAGCAALGSSAGMPLKFLMPVSLLLFLIIYLRLVDLPPEKTVFCYLNAVLLAAYCQLYTPLACAPLELGNPHSVATASSGLFCLALAIVILGVFYRTLTVKLPYLLTTQSLDGPWRALLLAPLLLSILFFYVTPRSAEVVMTGRVRITAMLFLILVPLAFLLLYHIMWRIVSQMEENAHLREAQELMEMETKRYEELRAYMKQTRALRHDFRQHLLAIHRFAKQGDTDALADYIREFIDVVSDHHTTLCANKAADAVAAHYESLAVPQQTAITWDLQLPEELPVREADFCGIFGNLLENALHATAGLPPEHRRIEVSARMLSAEMLGLNVRNPYAGTLRFDNQGLPLSDRPGHGVGLSSVQATVEKYHGALQIDTEGGVFAAGVLLYCSQT